MLFLAIYVDDILIFTNDTEQEIIVRTKLSERFKMKYMGKASSILGVRIQFDEITGQIEIDQERYIKDILKRFKMDDCNAVSTPLMMGESISKEMEATSVGEKKEMNRVPYRAAIGSLLFLALSTRPDIAFGVNLLSRYCENPGPRHWGAVKRILRYLKGTAKLKLRYGGDSARLTGYSDADWAGDLDNRRSTSGYVFTMYGGAISWCSRRQATVALSSTEAELISAVGCIQEAIWIRGLLNELFNKMEAVTINVDNKGAIHNLKNNNISSRTKHVDIKIRFITEKLKSEEIEIKYCPTNEMPADILTKAVPRSKLVVHLPKLGVNN